MKAYIFPGQGSQFPGMGKELYDSDAQARALFEKANDILGFRITDIMFEGTAEQLQETHITQPAIFIHSVIMAKINPDFSADLVAGHSLGEFSALVAANALSFEDGLLLVSARAKAMQKACEKEPSTMAAILGINDEEVVRICSEITEEIVVPANFNCPGQLVISGSIKGIEIACERIKAAGAKRALPLKVGGAFHSPLMEPAREELEKAIRLTTFKTPSCPVVQNVDAKPHSDPKSIQENLIAQLTAPVRWTQSVETMIEYGITSYIECGPGKVLQGLVKKIHAEATVASI